MNFANAVMVIATKADKQTVNNPSGRADNATPTAVTNDNTSPTTITPPFLAVDDF